MSRDITVHKLDCINEETQNALDRITELQDRIRARAQEFYLERGGTGGDAIDDWLRAEREVSWVTPEELQETDRAFYIRLRQLPHATIDVTVLPEMIILRDARAGEPAGKALGRRIALPAQVHPQSAVVRLDDDRLTVAVAKLAESRIDEHTAE
jgi:hypothetical protein